MTSLLQIILPVLMGGIGLSMAAGPLGSIIVWRRMAYFGDTLAHGTLLGIALAGLWKIQQSWITLVIVCTSIAISLAFLQKRTLLSTDTLLGIIAHSTLALGLILYTLNPADKRPINGLLFGDLVLLQWSHVFWIYAATTLILCFISMCWRALLNMLISEELARVESDPVDRINLLLILVIALFVAVSVPLVGVLLITSLLIIPAATARHWAKAPLEMCYLGSLFAALSVVAGIFQAILFDLPAGPSIVTSMAVLFFISYFYHRSFKQ